MWLEKLKKLNIIKISLIWIVLSIIGLGLAAASYANSQSSTSNVDIGSLTEEQAQKELSFIELQKKYANLNFLKDVDALKGLLDAKATFMLYTGTDACGWCRTSLHVDEQVVAARGSEFEDGSRNGLFRNMSIEFENFANGPINDETLNSTYAIYALHDTEYTSAGEYLSSPIATGIVDLLLGRLDDEEELDLVELVPYTNGAAVSLPTEIGTRASDFQQYFDAFNDADEIKLKVGTQSLLNLKSQLINSRRFATPSYWAIIDGQPRFLTSTYLTRKALDAYAAFFMSGNKTLDELKLELIS